MHTHTHTERYETRLKDAKLFQKKELQLTNIMEHFLIALECVS